MREDAVPTPTNPDPEWPAHFHPNVVRSGFGGGKLSSFCIALEAWRRGLEVGFLPPDATQVEISDGETTVRFDHSRPNRITKEAFWAVEDKTQTLELLRAHGIPVPDFYAFDTRQVTPLEVIGKAESIGFPVVLKPVRGSMGQGVFANITTPDQLARCYHHLVNELKTTRILLERHHRGQDVRVIVIGDKYVAAAKRVPANVIGDGKSSIDQLITAKNDHRKRNPFLSSGLITKDYEVTDKIYQSGYTLESILPNGDHLSLREKANASAGGDVIDITDDLPVSIREAAIRSVKAVHGLPLAGVDILWNQTQEHIDAEFAVIELNSRVHLGVNMYPTHGTGQDIPNVIIDAIFPRSSRGNAEAFMDLTFDRKMFAPAVSSGLASKVVLTPPPVRGYPVRRMYTVSRGLKLAPGQRSSLSQLAGRTQVACTLRLSGDYPQVKLGGTNLDSVHRFQNALSEKLGEKPQETDDWHGPLYVGFRVL